MPSESALNLNVHFTFRSGSNLSENFREAENLKALCVPVNFRVLDEDALGDGLMDADSQDFHIHEAFCISRKTREIAEDSELPRE